MQWFRRLCKEKFGSRSKSDAGAVNTLTTQKLKNLSQKNDNCRRECSEKCGESSISCADGKDSEHAQTETVLTAATTSTAKHRLKQMTATTAKLKQLTDKKTTAPINDGDVDDTRRSSSIDIEQSSNDDGSANVNVNGNGENDIALSKSEETRRKTKKNILVRNSDRESIGSVNVDVGSSTSRCDDSNGRQSLNGNHQYLHRRVRELEHFISTIGEENTTAWTAVKNEHISNESQHSSECTTPPPHSGNEHPILVDWVIVSLELERVSVHEYRFDDECQRTSAAKPESHPQQPCISSTEHDTHTTHATAPTAATSNDYGPFHSRNRTIQYLLWFMKLFDFNIKTGSLCPSPSASAFSAIADDTAMKSNVSLYSSRYVSADSLYSVSDQRVELNYMMQHEPGCSHKLASKESIDLLDGMPLVHSLCTSEASMATPKFASIPEYFGLNDYGDIIIHVDHVGEEKGFGFKMHRKKSVYRKIVRGKEVSEKKYGFKVAMKRFFKELISAFCECCRGEYKAHQHTNTHEYMEANVVQCIGHARESALSGFYNLIASISYREHTTKLQMLKRTTPRHESRIALEVSRQKEQESSGDRFAQQSLCAQ